MTLDQFIKPKKDPYIAEIRKEKEKRKEEEYERRRI